MLIDREVQMRLAKQLLESGVLSEESAKAIKADFPELAESEEVDTRQEIVNFIGSAKDCGSMTPDQMKRSGAWFAWLEKQKDETKKETPAWMPKFLDELRTKSYLDWDEHKDMEGKVLAIIRWIAPNYFHEKHKEQKPADQVFTFDDVLALESAMALARDDEKLHDALKSIFDRVYDAYYGEQQPAEWSEEDNEKFKMICAALEHTACEKMLIGWIRNHVQSLRPPFICPDCKVTDNLWKPSEEQMNSLKAAIEEAKEYPEAGANWEQLQGIFDHLNKLM